jgi:hypothetical protein
MRTRSVISMAILAIAIAATSAAIGYAQARHAATPARSTKASLRIVKYGPITVQGTRFTPDMQVKVTYSSSQRVVRLRTADRHGAFTVVFRITADRCAGYVITARQRNGTIATVHGPHPMCAPMGTQ